MSNLYELSIQLRKLQADKNEMTNEIDRLERQLRILSELKGISVSDLQRSLKTACEAEAHGELRALVGTLQARVDGLRLGGFGAGGGTGEKGENERKDCKNELTNEKDKTIPSQDRFNEEAASRARVALELRIGELEEIDSNRRLELDSMYHKHQALADKKTLLETQLLHQKKQLDQYESRWKDTEEEEMKRSSSVISAAGNSTECNTIVEFANAPAVIDLENRLIIANTELAGEKHQRSILQSQLSSAQKTFDIKEQQYQHRVIFFEEQVRDLEQQLSSLYTAFGIMQDDNKKERSEMEVWRNTLLESDAALAKEHAIQEAKNFDVTDTVEEGDNVFEQQSNTPHKNNRSHRHSINKSSRRSAKETSNSPYRKDRTTVNTSSNEPIAMGSLLLLLDNERQPLQPNANCSPKTTRQRSFRLKKMIPVDSEVSMKFIKQYCILHGTNGLYQLRYGDSFNGPVAGVHEFITSGVSSIEHTPRSSCQPYGFEIVINSNISDSPSLCCAAESEADFLMWMSALSRVTEGSEGLNETALVPLYR